MQQVTVGDAAQPGQRLGVVGHHRAAGQVGARQHQRRRPAKPAVRQQQVQRRVGQQQPQAAVLAQKRQAARPGRAAFFQQYNGPPRALQQRGLFFCDTAQPPRGLQIAAQYGQRFFLAVFAAAQPAHGGCVLCVAGQVDAARALHRHDAPGPQRPLRQGHGVAGQLPPAVVQVKRPRPAHRAAVGLGVVAAGGNVGILGRAGRAHGKPRHRRVGAVVGQRPQNRKPRPAVGTVGKRVAVTAAGRVGQFFFAGGAGGQVGRGQRGGGPGGAGQNGKAIVAGGACQRLRHHVLHHRQRRRGGAHGVQKGLDAFRLAGQRQFHPGGGVARPAGQLQALRQPVQKRPEPHPLHDAGNLHPHMAGPGSDLFAHASAARMRPARCALSSSTPAPVRAAVSNSGAPGLTPR